MGKADTDRDISQHQGDDRRVSKDWIPFAHNLEQVLSRHTGQDVERLRTDTDHDRVFTAPEAVAYGLLDLVIEQR